MSIAAVVPTCRGFEIPWQTEEVHWIIVHDQHQHPITLEEEPHEYNGRPLVAPRPDANIIKPDARLYGEKTSAIRQAGLDYAYAAGYDYILSLDDDCVVPRNWAESHREALGGRVPLANNTVPGQVIRGNPLGTGLPVSVSHGLWSGVLDYPAWYQIAANPGRVIIPDKGWQKINAPFPMCGMNVGFRRAALPAVYFQHRFLRHDDIFAGWFAERVLQIEGYGFVNGGAVVQHERASNAQNNLIKEQPGDAVNNWLLTNLADVALGPTGDTAATFIETVLAVASRIRTLDSVQRKRTHQMLNDQLAWATRSLR